MCIESLLAQDYPASRYDVLVIENGSTDATTEVVSRYPVRLLHSHARGPAAARNLGLRHTCADIVAYTDADCIAHTRWISELVRTYTADPTVGGVGGPILAYVHDARTAVERLDLLPGEAAWIDPPAGSPLAAQEPWWVPGEAPADA